MRKNSLFSFGLVGLLVLGITACQPDPTITVLGEDSSNLAAIESVKGDFEKAFGIKVKIEKTSFPDLVEKANQDLSLGTGKYDIVLQYNFTLSSYVEGDFVWKLDDLKVKYPSVSTDFDKDIFENAWKEVGYYRRRDDPSGQPSAFGYPFASNTMLMVYNKPMLEDDVARAAFQKRYGHELTPPRTWKEFAEVAEFFTNPNKKTYGVALQGAAGGWLYYEWAAIVNSMGGKVLPKTYGWEPAADARVDLSDEKIRDASQFYLSLKRFNYGDFLKTDAVVQREALKTGHVALAIMWSDYVYDLSFPNGARSNAFGYAVLPGISSPLAGGSFYINKRSRYDKEAFKFVTWLMDAARQHRLMQKGLASPLRGAYTPQVATEIPYSDALRKSIERGTYAFEANKDSELIQNEITTAMQTAWADPARLLAELDGATGRINANRSALLNK